jgi:hypothetical protein
VRHAPGFVSAALHRSLDGERRQAVGCRGGPSLMGSVASRTMLHLPASRRQGHLEVLRNVTDDIHEGA